MDGNLCFRHKEFEWEVRDALGVYDRPLQVSDVQNIEEMDCSNFTFDPADIHILQKMCRLKFLSIDIGKYDLSFLSAFPFLETVSIVYWNDQNVLDFSVFKTLTGLREVYVSGGDISDIALVNLDALANLPRIRFLSLHEFGSVDLAPLKNVQTLEELFCGWGNQVFNINVIGQMTGLKSVELIDIVVEELAFLDALPDSVEILLCGVEVRKPYDFDKLKRFHSCDVSEMIVNGKEIDFAWTSGGL